MVEGANYEARNFLVSLIPCYFFPFRPDIVSITLSQVPLTTALLPPRHKIAYRGCTAMFHAFGKQSRNVISGFRRGVKEIFVLLGYYAE